MGAIPFVKEGIEYPTSDGQPMAETTLHQTIMVDLIHGMRGRYATVPDVWVGGNLFLCYEKGNPAAILAPDVLVARGVEKWMRPNYLLWDEVPPSLVIEVTSRSTRYEDQKKKRDIYERIGVEEYVFFDPYREYLRPPLQGLRLQDGRYQPIPLEPDGGLVLRTVGVKLLPEGDRLRMIDVATGERLLWPDEEAAARAEARAQAAQELKARQAAEARVRALEEELIRLCSR
ncbi:MAG TPA: Uma2 family endonuclease [Thermoanaerobaculia bacterium]|nr:Uma2 family endonuclease [Thermoanaerobaculia bacterium]